MDDIRRPSQQRRDFALRHRAHQPQPQSTAQSHHPHPLPQPVPHPQPAPHHHQHQPVHHQAHHQPLEVVSPPESEPYYVPSHYEQLPYDPAPEPEPGYIKEAPVHHQPAAHSYEQHPQGHETQAAGTDEYQHYSRPAYHPRPQTAPKSRTLPKIPKVSLKYPAIAAAITLGIAVGIALKPSSNPKTLPTAITKQADFTVYFPSPMPSGYGYMKDTATFQIGEVFFKFSNGKKKVTVKEEATPDPAPNLSLYTGYNQYDLPIGKAVIGKSLGEPVAIVLTTHTVITLNGVGGTTPDDLLSAAKNLQIIGQSTDHKS